MLINCSSFSAYIVNILPDDAKSNPLSSCFNNKSLFLTYLNDHKFLIHASFIIFNILSNFCSFEYM